MIEQSELTKFIGVIGDIEDQVLSQIIHFGSGSQRDTKLWYTHLGKAKGKVSRAILERKPDEYRLGLLRVAAVCVSIMRTFDSTIFTGDLIAAEWERQNTKWGKNRTHTPEFWQLILDEEIGEIAEADLDMNQAHYLVEVCQAATVCVSAVLSHDLVSADDHPSQVKDGHVKFYDVRAKGVIQVKSSNVTKNTWTSSTGAVRYCLKTRLDDGRILTKFIGEKEWRDFYTA